MKRSLTLVVTLAGALLLTAAVLRSVAAASPTAGAAKEGPHSPATRQGALRPRTVAPAQNCEDGEQASGAKYRICLPVFGGWNDLVVYAHGYMAPDRPVEIPQDQMSLPGFALTVDQIVTSMGYAFATTSYYTNGLAVRPAISDLLDRVN